MVLDGAYGDGHRSARRHRGFESLPMSNHPVYRPDGRLVPAQSGSRPRPWSTSSATRGPRSSRPFPAARCTPWGRAATGCGPPSTHRGASKTFASEVVAADLNKDGTPELVFGTYALHRNAGRLIVLSAHGKKLSVTRLRHQAS